jgi:hypothetical protein
VFVSVIVTKNIVVRAVTLSWLFRLCCNNKMHVSFTFFFNLSGIFGSNKELINVGFNGVAGGAMHRSTVV